MKAIAQSIFFSTICVLFFCSKKIKHKDLLFEVSDVKINQIDTTLDAGDLGNGILKIDFLLTCNYDSIFLPTAIKNPQLLEPFSIEKRFLIKGKVFKTNGVSDFLYLKSKFVKNEPKQVYLIIPHREYVDTCKFFFNLFKTSQSPLDSIGVLNICFNKNTMIERAYFEIVRR